jgi:hypothetical protein
MIKHIFLPEIPLQKGFIHPAYEQYLKEWRNEAIQRADDGDVAASICHQASLIDFVLDGKLRHDWLGVMDEYLMDEGKPLAYSAKFGKRLYKFEGQHRQSTVHAIHTRWWIECVNSANSIKHGAFATLILQKKQSDGLIYDRDVSETMLRHRMKSELTMSMAMGAEILAAANMLVGATPLEFATNLVSPAKCPALGYMSMEYFRLKALELLGHTALFPVNIEEHIDACAEGLLFGLGDFSMKSKVDAYMGTAKRTRRDKPIHSPLIACHVKALRDMIQDTSKRNALIQRLQEYSCYLKKNPMDIPAFQMRDIPIRFGADRTPIEIICASYLISQCKDK